MGRGRQAALRRHGEPVTAPADRLEAGPAETLDPDLRAGHELGGRLGHVEGPLLRGRLRQARPRSCGDAAARSGSAPDLVIANSDTAGGVGPPSARPTTSSAPASTSSRPATTSTATARVRLLDRWPGSSAPSDYRPVTPGRGYVPADAGGGRAGFVIRVERRPAPRSPAGRFIEAEQLSSTAGRRVQIRRSIATWRV